MLLVLREEQEAGVRQHGEQEGQGQVLASEQGEQERAHAVSAGEERQLSAEGQSVPSGLGQVRVVP